jgi:outer membrane protein assembly factor BamB
MQFSAVFNSKRKHHHIALMMMAAAAVLWMLPRVVLGAITPTIVSISDPVIVGNSLTIIGAGFTSGSVADFFVATATGPKNFGPLTPSAQSITALTLPVPISTVTTLGQGVVSVVVVNTDQGFTHSNVATAQLLGDTRAGFPNLLKINGVGLAATSTDPSYATDNVETVVMQNHAVTLGGMGFDTAHGVAIDLFCDRPGGKIPTIFLNPGAIGLTATLLSFTLPASAVTGPGSFVISNRGTKGDYALKSNAVSVTVGAPVTVSGVKQTGCTVAVNGSGFAVTGTGLPPLTAINLFNRQSGGVANLGGLTEPGEPKIALKITSAKQLTFSLAGTGLESGPSYVQVLNPPFVPFTSSGDTANGAFTGAGCALWPMFHLNPRHTGLSPFSTASDTGVMKWKFITSDVVGSSPAVGADGTIYVGSYDHNLYAVNADGSQRWKFTTGDAVASSPAVGADGTIYVGSFDHNLYAINPDGLLKWKFATGGGVPSSPVVDADGTICVASYDHNLYAVNADGSQKWKFNIGSQSESSPAVGADGTIYVGADNNNLYAVNPDGSQKWKFTTGNSVFSSPAVGADGTIYVGSYDHNLYAVKPDGSQKWKFTTGDNVYSSPAVGAGGTIYVGSFDHNLYAINADGSQKWKFTTGDHVVSSPAVGADGTIYVGSYDHHLYAVHPDGTQKWKFTMGDVVVPSPAVGADGTIYIGSYDHNLYTVH